MTWERVDAGMAQAEALAERLAADERFALWGPPVTGVVVFKPTNGAARAVRDNLRDAWVSLTDIDGEPWLRAVAANPSADPEWVYQRLTEAIG